MVTPANGRLVHGFQPTGGSRLLTFLFSPRNTSLPLPLSHAAQAGRPPRGLGFAHANVLMPEYKGIIS